MLNEQQAADIYRFKIWLQRSAKANPSHYAFSWASQSHMIAKRYCVSSRAIRDIWGRRSWQYATCHIWPQDDDCFDPDTVSSKVLVEEQQ